MYQHYVNIKQWGSYANVGGFSRYMYMSIFTLVIKDEGYLIDISCTQEVHYT